MIRNRKRGVVTVQLEGSSLETVRQLKKGGEDGILGKCVPRHAVFLWVSFNWLDFVFFFFPPPRRARLVASSRQGLTGPFPRCARLGLVVFVVWFSLGWVGSGLIWFGLALLCSVWLVSIWSCSPRRARLASCSRRGRTGPLRRCPRPR